MVLVLFFRVVVWLVFMLNIVVVLISYVYSFVFVSVIVFILF